jgi:hypothetical protein
MTTTWIGLLPTIAVHPWVARWSGSGWSQRPAPTSEPYERARREGVTDAGS